ncbi:MgtC/SapB family protein [Hyperthermus butylicus]|uniref:Conserved archaeal protein n=1 Tax=Hyperthermus butylicus (strain DSM 5456 / JCM 9403 / PLM1-5) TaxID=415426 RepID=A2BLG5_HYPBU|nr:MgtC/SapB family protein [Hyperthermus butylicus]ABM80826.1 conserved archaeal protein [Hyperthermus butylicus DSM 5456]
MAGEAAIPSVAWNEQVGLLARIVVALFAGMLVGIEREKARTVALRSRRRTDVEEIVIKEVPGLRTFSLVAVFGSILGILWSGGYIDSAQTAVLLGVFGIIVAVFATHRLLVMRSTGITTIIVLLVDFGIGLLAGLGLILVAVSVAVLSTFMLAIKLPAERIVGRIRYEEFLWALELGVILIVVGPFFLGLPASFYGVSLRSLYLFFALVLATSYLGYVMARLKGGEGIAYTAFFGGLANSEATLVGLLSILDQTLRRLLAFDVTVLSNTAMILRNTVIAAVMTYVSGYVDYEVVILVPLLASTALALLPAVLSWRRAPQRIAGIESLRIENPLRLSTAARMTLLYVAIAFTANVVRRTGILGLISVAAAGGFVSSGATIIALFSVDGIDPALLPALVLIAVVMGVLNKPVYVYIAGWKSREVLAKVGGATLLQAVLMVPGLLITLLL